MNTREQTVKIGLAKSILKLQKEVGIVTTQRDKAVNALNSIRELMFSLGYDDTYYRIMLASKVIKEIKANLPNKEVKDV